MAEFLNKLEEYIFDIIGLVLPGFVFLMLITAPLLLFNVDKVSESKVSEFTIISTLHIIKKTLNNIVIKNNNPNTETNEQNPNNDKVYKAEKEKENSNDLPYYGISFLIIIIISYILGHLIKVFSIIIYEFLDMLFDKTINKIFKYLLRVFKNTSKKIIFWIYHREWLKKLLSVRFKNWIKNIFIKWFFKDLLKPFKNLFNKLFTFHPPFYYPENQFMDINNKKIIHDKLQIQFPENWYTSYKFSDILIKGENIKSLSFIFLAKYNLYRSLSFIFMLVFIYYFIFFQASFLSPDILKLRLLILVIIALLWFTFHIKYKRYWTLCGNEALVSLFYFFNRAKLRSET